MLRNILKITGIIVDSEVWYKYEFIQVNRRSCQEVTTHTANFVGLSLQTSVGLVTNHTAMFLGYL